MFVASCRGSPGYLRFFHGGGRVHHHLVRYTRHLCPKYVRV